MKKKPDKKFVLAVLVLLAGAASASGPKSFSEQPPIHKQFLATGAIRA